MMNCTATRKLRLKDIHNNIYNTDEILELLKDFEGKEDYAGHYLLYACFWVQHRKKSGQCLSMWSNWFRQKSNTVFCVPFPLYIFCSFCTVPVPVTLPKGGVIHGQNRRL